MGSDRKVLSLMKSFHLQVQRSWFQVNIFVCATYKALLVGPIILAPPDSRLILATKMPYKSNCHSLMILILFLVWNALI